MEVPLMRTHVERSKQKKTSTSCAPCCLLRRTFPGLLRWWPGPLLCLEPNCVPWDGALWNILEAGWDVLPGDCCMLAVGRLLVYGFAGHACANQVWLEGHVAEGADAHAHAHPTTLLPIAGWTANKLQKPHPAATTGLPLHRCPGRNGHAGAGVLRI